MELHPSLPGISLRPANASDAVKIRRMIWEMRINPTGLNWRHFVLATGAGGDVIGCGQVKPHADGSRELASIAVLPEWRGKGVARRIIEHLLEQYSGRLYLTCRSSLGPLYQKFGFQVVQIAEMPPYFQRLSRIVTLMNKLTHQPNILLVMRRN